MTVTPLEYNVVIAPDPVEEKTKGGVYIPEATRDREEVAASTGTVVAVSPGAFVYEAGGEVVDMKPALGARVAFVRYAGVLIESENVRIMKDKDVMGVLS